MAPSTVSRALATKPGAYDRREERRESGRPPVGEAHAPLAASAHALLGNRALAGGLVDAEGPAQLVDAALAMGVAGVGAGGSVGEVLANSTINGWIAAFGAGPDPFSGEVVARAGAEEAFAPGWSERLAVATARGGQPLPEVVRVRMEQAFGGRDFSGVRVHTDAAARQAAEAIHAVAFAVGEDVYFGAEGPRLGSAAGDEVLAHELAHVVQHQEGRMGGAGGVSSPSDPLELEAVRVAREVVAAAPAIEGGITPELAPAQPSAGTQPSAAASSEGAPVHRAKGGMDEEEDEDAETFREVGAQLVGEDDAVYDVVRYDGDAGATIRPVGGGEDREVRRRSPGVWEPAPAAEGVDEEPCEVEGPEAAPTFVQGPEREWLGSPSTRLAQPEGSKKKLTEQTSVVTGFTVQVTVAPIAQGRPVKPKDGFEDVVYTAAQVWVESIRIGNTDRPDTRYGTKQESHTVAWTLERAAQAAQSGQPLSAVLSYYLDELRGLDGSDQPEVAEVLIQMVLIAEEALRGGELPIDRWQAVLSNVAKGYTQAYQASASATFKKGRAVGHGESHAMGVLRAAEENVGAVGELGGLQAAASTLLDVNFGASLGEEGYGLAVGHWIHALGEAFPRLMAAHGARIIDPVLRRKVAAGVARRLKLTTVEELVAHFGIGAAAILAGSAGGGATLDRGGMPPALTVAVPSSMEADFVANVELAPEATGTLTESTSQVSGSPEVKLALPFYTAAQLSVRRVSVSDKDRPDTRFASQMSHTVAWTLMRADLAAFAGTPLSGVIEELGRRSVGQLQDLDVPDAVSLALANIEQLRRLAGASLPIHQWQAVISDLVRRYTLVYQKLGSASYVDETTLGRALGHGEGPHMERLRQNEAYAKENGDLKDPPGTVVAAVVALFDAHVNGTLSAERFVSAALHWHEMVNRVFPTLAKAGGERFLEAALTGRAVPKEVAETYKVKDQLELVRTLEKRIGAARELFGRLGEVHKSRGAASLDLLRGLNFAHAPMDGSGNDCAIQSAYHQLTTVHGLAVGDFVAFRDHVRTNAALAFGTMIDLLGNGGVFLAAIQGYLNANVPAAAGGGLRIDIWSATGDGGLMQFQDVAVHAAGPVRTLTIYFNGVNHFDSIAGPLARL